MTILQSQTQITAFSADVRLTLSINGQEFDLAEAGPKEIVLRHAQKVPSGPARLTTEIDGRNYERQVQVQSQAHDLKTIMLSD